MTPAGGRNSEAATSAPPMGAQGETFVGENAEAKQEENLRGHTSAATLFGKARPALDGQLSLGSDSLSWRHHGHGFALLASTEAQEPPRCDGSSFS